MKKAAEEELLEHFEEESALAGLVSTDTKNLEDAIQGESYEVDTMYRDFAEQALSLERQPFGERFAETHRDEMKHRDAFKRALAKSGKHPSYAA